MKYLPLVWAGLWRTPLRTALTFLSIATTFLLFGSLYGVNAGLNQAIERISPKRLHVTPINLDRGLPVSYGQEIDQIPGVASTMVSTLMSASYRDPRNYLYIAAVSGRVHLDVFGDIPDGDRLVAKLQATRTGAIVGRHSRKNGFKVDASHVHGPGSESGQHRLHGVRYRRFTTCPPELARWFL
jgi:putative ABC transport system permease protein